MQFSDLHFKHPHILHTWDDLSRSNFFSSVYHPQNVGVSEMQIRELHFYLPTPLQLLHRFCCWDQLCRLKWINHKYSSLNWNAIVTYGYDCENGVDECVKIMLTFAGFPAKSDLLQSIALYRSYKCTFYFKEACTSCYNMRFDSKLVFV